MMPKSYGSLPEVKTAAESKGKDPRSSNVDMKLRFARFCSEIQGREQKATYCNPGWKTL